MNKGKYVFSRLLEFLDPFVFLRISKKYGGDKYVKSFSCWNQLAVLMFGQLSNRESLRDVALATQALSGKAYHLGFGKYATKSNLSKANKNRDYHIFEEFAYYVIADARKCRATDIFKLNGHVYAFDSTTIELCLNAFKWAVYRKNQGKGGIKVHTLYDIETSIPTFFHITEARVNDMNAMDAIPYEENKRKFIFFTNAFAEDERLDISPMMVAELYRNRWQIELFFKWMKQHLKIKKFWGETENAVRIQIYSAIIAYCMMAIMQKKIGIERSIYEMLQVASISLTETLPLNQLFGKPNYNIVNELNGSSEPLNFI